jgi:hypothetical protein
VSRRVHVVTRVRCTSRRAVIEKIHEILPFVSCQGVEVECAGPFVKVQAMCPRGEADGFRKLIRRTVRYPILEGKKRRR